MRAVVSAVVWAMTGVAALAQDAIVTPSGPAEIVQDGTGHMLLIAGMGFPIKGMMYVDFAARVGNLVLVAQYSGGTLCPARFAWLDTSPGRVRLTESFGTCSDRYEITAEAGTVRVEMPELGGEERRVFVWDGEGRVVEEAAGAAVVVPGPRRLSWAGWGGRRWT
jgi:hypothetical protein